MKPLGMISLILLLSCSTNENMPPEESIQGGLMPLSAGNYWIYTIFYKNSDEPSVRTEQDTLRVESFNGYEYYLSSRTQIVIPNGYYINAAGGLYSQGELEFKYPGEVDDYCGKMTLGEIVNHLGESPDGRIFRTDYEITISDLSGAQSKLQDCYYYSLVSYFPDPDTKKSGITVFKPGIGLVFKDWVDIELDTNEFKNNGASLREYKLN